MNSGKTASKLVGLVLVASLGLSGCVIPVPAGVSIGQGQNNNARANATPAELELRDRSAAMQKTILEGIAAGAAAGLALSAINQSGQRTVQNVAIGALIGGLAGSYVGHLQRNYATREEQLARARADIFDTNKEVKATLRVMRAVVSTQIRDLENLRVAVAAGQADQSALNQELRDARANLRDMEGAADGAERRRRDFARAGNDDPSGRMDRELAELSGRISEMRQVADELSEEV